jgi:uncharacterized membrane protein
MPDNVENHTETINKIYLQTKEDLWTREFATLVLLLFAVLFLTIVLNVVFYSFGNWFVTFLIYLAEIAATVFVLYRHQQKIYEAVRAKASEMDSTTHPGISAAYNQWRSNANN